MLALDQGTAKPAADGTYHAVVFVHGLTGSAATWHETIDGGFDPYDRNIGKSNLTQVSKIPGMVPYTFDYHADSLRWVTDNALAPAFGRAIDCLYSETGEPVSVVAHSMGGLIARYAANHDGRSARMGAVITIGTPYLGSVNDAIIRQLLTIGTVEGTLAGNPAVPLVRAMLYACGRAATSNADACQDIGVFRTFDSDAGRALVPGSADLARLQPWPAGMDVHALAGDEQFEAETLFYGRVKVYSNGDTAVGADSATADATQHRVWTCPITSDPVAWIWQHLFSAKSDQEATAISVINGPCEHSHLIRDVEVSNEILGTLHDYLDALKPLTASSLLSAPVPAACRHPAGRLSNGQLPGIPTGKGSMSLGWINDARRRSSALVLGDLTGDGRGDAAAVLYCDAGGVSWPELVAFYAPGPVLLGSVDLGSVNLPGHQPGENATVYQLRYDAGKVDASWATQQAWDPAAVTSLDYSAVLGPASHDRLAVSHLAATNEVPTATQFVADLRGRNRPAAAVFAAAGVADQAASLMSSYPAAPNATPDCHGINDPALPSAVAQLENGGSSTDLSSDRLCLLSTNGASGYSYVVLGMTHTSFRTWRVQWTAAA